VLGKPGDAATARAQLQLLSGRRARFLTALAVREPRGGPLRHGIVATDVDFRVLDARAIARYVEIEQPLDCAGSFKSEGLGIVLFERLVSDDPTALIGLPLILLNRFLRLAGLDPLAAREPDTT
jgi:septum formation protein